ncbi:MAG: GNAT family N-acetyltransferase [Planctomycetes bacterium]|nr:GNAT family N-acetyltransferase [Planctomycetota bacterium]
MDGYEVRSIPPHHPAFTAAFRQTVGTSRRPTGPRPGNARAGGAARALEESDDRFAVGVFRAGQLVWAAAVLVSPGAAALVFVPEDPIPGLSLEPQVSCLRQVQQLAGTRGLKLLEVLTDPDARQRQSLTAVLEGGGFRYLTRLIYLTRRAAAVALASAADALHWVGYTPDHEPTFLAALEATYSQSLDCPELTGTRTVAEVLEGHRAAGVFDPALWWVVRRRGVAAGVLLLGRIPAAGAVEVVYLGVAQLARGTGVGDALVARALAAAQGVGATSVTLAVDCRNLPALRLYQRWGFSAYGQRDAWIATCASV